MESVAVLRAAVWRARRFGEVSLTIMAHEGWREWSGLALSLESQAAQRSWRRPWAEACRDSLGVSCRGWGTLSGPGAGDAVPASVLAPLPPQHFLIPAPNNNSPRCSHSDRPRPRPGCGPAARDGDAGVAPSAPGVRRDDVYAVVSKGIVHGPQRRPVFGV